MSQALSYRRDIDGLRCIAVMSVVLYHLGNGWIPGGFVGVDVFFVVSGFLITGKLRGDLGTANGTLGRFYLGRMRRLAPAFIAVAIATTLLSLWLLTPRDLHYYTASLVAAFASISNVFFGLMSGGYFDSRMEEFPLLHTWSLSVEEQFYLVWAPIILFLSARRGFGAAVAVAGAASLGASWIATEMGWPSAYFLLQYRAFELLLGAGVAILAEREFVLRRVWVSTTAAAVGLAMIVGSMLVLNKSDPFPGINAMVPTVGTALVIIGGLNQKAWVARALALQPFVAIGLVSYSLYLWHWPIFALMRVRQVPPDSPLWAVALMTALAIAWLSWRFIEIPYRTVRLYGLLGTSLRLLVAPLVVAILLFAVSHVSGGLPQRFSGPLRTLMASYSQEFDIGRQCSWAPASFGQLDLQALTRQCRIGGKLDKPVFLLMGDSHANHVKGFFDAIGQGSGAAGVYHVQGGCSPVDGALEDSATDPSRAPCFERNQALIGMTGSFQHVILASKWSSRIDDGRLEERLLRVVERIRTLGGVAVILREMAHTGEDKSHCPIYQMRGWISDPGNCALEKYAVDEHQRIANDAISSVQRRLSDVIVIDPKPLTCTDTECAVQVDGLAIYRDANHLNSAASVLLGQRYLARFGSPLSTR